MAWGLVIPADEAQPIHYKNFTDYTEYQAVIGGPFQPVYLPSPEACIYVHEEGKLLDLPLNRRATLLLWVHNRAFHGHDALFGDVVLIGPPDSDGETEEVPEEYARIFLKTFSFKVEVETIDEPGKWYGNQARYDNWVDAYNGALSLYERWTLATNIRVLAA